MKKVERATQFKRDLKRYLNKPETIQKLLDVVRLLENDKPIPQEFRPHKLVGNYRGCMECHVESDSLLIWVDNKKNLIRLLRFGSHSELY